MIRLLGALSIEDSDRTLGPGDLGGARPKQVLEILLAARGHRVPTDRLAELLWGDDRPQNVAGSLQTFVSVLRRHLTADAERARQLVVTEPEAYRFATEHVALDLDCFDELLERSGREPTDRARAALEQALELVRGELLEDEPYTTWALDLRGTYQGRILGARLDAADGALAERDFAAALTHAQGATTLDRFSERAHRCEMLSLYALGRTHEALTRYREYRKRLDEELGLEPTAETRTMEAAIIRQENVESLLPRPIRRANGDGNAADRLVGRCAELDTLGRAVRRGFDEGLALIQIEGETGLGKTRLLDELQTQLGGLRIGRATCSLFERHLPYVPLAAALRDALPDIALEAERLPALSQILPELALSTQEQRFEEIVVLEALVAVVAEHGPLVLLVDDLHLADARTLAALGYLHRRRAALAGAIVTTAGPTGASLGHPTHRLKADARIRLEPLSPDELGAFGIPELHESTGGDPRLVAETLRNGDGACPSATLTDALLAQCRSEGDWAYRVLVAASVLEQPFEPEPLADLLEVDTAELIEELERLCERRILRVDGFGFRFRYDLVRQVLLGNISPARQRLLQQRLELLVSATAEAS